MKKFYRVENPETMNGLWYNQEGRFTGLIHKREFKDLQNHHLKMPYNNSIKGYLSVADSLEDLKNWFNDADMKILEPFGYKITEYESDDFLIIDNHYVINQTKSKRTNIFI